MIFRLLFHSELRINGNRWDLRRKRETAMLCHSGSCRCCQKACHRFVHGRYATCRNNAEGCRKNKEVHDRCRGFSRGFWLRSRSGYSVARFAETALGAAALVAPGIEEPTNTASGSNEDEDETPLDPVVVISNDKSTEFFLATVVEEAA